MPQVRIEYSGNLGAAFDARRLASEIHRHLTAIIDTELASCKTRLVELDDWLIGDGAERNAMVHVDLRILPGRTDDQKRCLAEAVAASLAEAVPDPGDLAVQLTVELGDLGPHYQKRRL